MRASRFACIAALILMPRVVAAEGAGASGVASDLVFGMSTALTGPTGILGTNMRDGVLAAFEETNRTGGIRGRLLRLVVLDDRYEPLQTAPNIRRLISEENVLAILGDVGTPTAVTAIPITIKERVLFYGAYTGAGVLRRTPPDRYVVNFRASYTEEMSALVDALMSAGLAPEEVAFFTQRDSYGDSGFAGGLAALKQHGLADESAVPHARYERNTEAVEDGLADILFQRRLPKAVIMVGAYAPCARFIRLARAAGFNPLFLNVSFVGGTALANALGADGEGVVVSQVVPHFDADAPAARAYRAAIAAMDPSIEPTFGSFEGYVTALTLIHALRVHEKPVTREGILEALESLGRFDIGLGCDLRLSADRHQASSGVWPTVIQGGKVRAITWPALVAQMMAAEDGNE
jgi:ABC-type branched-subunit amino acid transport system substrate-binding protein